VVPLSSSNGAEPRDQHLVVQGEQGEELSSNFLT